MLPRQFADLPVALYRMTMILACCSYAPGVVWVYYDQLRADTL